MYVIRHKLKPVLQIFACQLSIYETEVDFKDNLTWLRVSFRLKFSLKKWSIYIALFFLYDVEIGMKVLKTSASHSLLFLGILETHKILCFCFC